MRSNDLGPRQHLLASAVLAIASVPAMGQACGTFQLTVPGYGPGEGSVINFVHDPVRNYLYIARPQGTLDRFDVEARQMLPRWNVGVFPQGLDVTEDGAHVIVAEEFRQTGFAGRALKVNADTGAVTPIPLGPTGNWDVVVMGGNRAFVTPIQAVVSSEQRLREIDLTTNTWQDRPDVPFSNGQVRPQSTLARSPDRSRLFLQEGGVDPWNTATFLVGTNVFSALGQRYAGAAYNADASRMAALWSDGGSGRTVRVLDTQSGAVVASFSNEHALAIAFDPVRPRLYFVHRTTDELVTVSTATWQIIGRRSYPIDFDRAFQAAVASDGSVLFVQNELGIVGIELGEPVCRCAPDLTTTGAVVPGQTGFGVPDGLVNNDDFFYYLTLIAFNMGCSPGMCPSPPDLTTTGAVMPGVAGFGVPDGVLNNEDFFYFLGVFAAGC